ncbi:MAG: hypothetical protein HQ559_01965, partial [Lentisphaerae bacterium]|nr:hypothetical protein [Lentisphaerota bacterium]
MTKAYYRLPEDLSEDIDAYEGEVQRFLAGDLPAGVLKAKRVPRGVYEQRQDGTYMVRVRVAGGTLTRAQTRELSRLSAEFGNGVLHATTRQDVQLHDVSIENTPGVMRRLMAAGLTSKGGGGNTVRNVTACPYAGICCHEGFDVTPFAHAVTQYLIPLVGSYNLPRKYKIAFSGCATDCALAQVSDLGFIAEVRDGEPGFRVVAGGGMGANSRVADEFIDWTPVSEVIRIAETVRRLFDRLGNRGNKNRARLRYVFEKIGVDAFKEQFLQERETVEKDGVPEWQGEVPLNHEQAAGHPALEVMDGIRCLAQRQEGFVAVPIHLPLGFIPADDFARIGDVVSRFSGEGGLRTTRMQNLLIRFVARENIHALADELGKLRTDVLSPVPLEHFVACAGASTCRLGLCLARGAARACAPALDNPMIAADTLDAVEIYMNGCPNACGHQPVGPIGFFGAAQRSEDRLVPCYRVTLGGRCNNGGARLGTAVGQVPARALPVFLATLVRDFQDCRHEGESFPSYFDRTGNEHFEEIVNRHAEVPAYEDDPGFYRDFGVEEDFSLAGRGAGECGSGVFEVIQDDLAAARKAVEPFDVILPAARALLITRGVDAQDIDTVLREFETHFVDAGLVSADFRPLLSRARGYAEGWQQAFDGQEDAVGRLLERVELLYSTLDANLEFHPPDAPSPPSPPAPGADTYPLSHAQWRLWVLDKLQGGNVAYNMPLGFWIEGPLD